MLVVGVDGDPDRLASYPPVETKGQIQFEMLVLSITLACLRNKDSNSY